MRTEFNTRVLIPILFVIFFLAGCASNASVNDPLKHREAAKEDLCDLDASPLSLRDVKPDSLPRFISFSNNEQLGSFKIRRTSIIGGKCASQVARHQADSAYLYDGRTIQLYPKPRIATPGYSYVEPTFSSDTAHKYMSGRLIMADRVSHVGEEEILVGLWPEREKFSIIAFRKSKSGKIGAATSLAKVSRPVSGILYFPSPDSAGGTLTLTVDDGSDKVLMWIDWEHPNLFNSLPKP